MTRHPSRRSTRSCLIAVTAAALAALALASPPARASAEDSAEGQPEVLERSPLNVVEEGILHNMAHGFRFPVPQGFQLRASSNANEIVLVVPNCDECILRVLVSPGNTDSLDTTVRALKKQVASEPNAHVIDEQRTRVAREPAYTLVKEETPEAEAPANGSSAPPASGPRLLTRYVTFNHGEDKYYFVLREPASRFKADEDAFEHLLSKLRFDP
jgi:hypothetical protein